MSMRGAWNRFAAPTSTSSRRMSMCAGSPVKWQRRKRPNVAASMPVSSTIASLVHVFHTLTTGAGGLPRSFSSRRVRRARSAAVGEVAACFSVRNSRLSPAQATDAHAATRTTASLRFMSHLAAGC
jgi:hypothetical protein